jgi:hypothetical protein
MTDMTTKATAIHTEAATAPTLKELSEANSRLVTLDQLAREVKVSPRDARMLLRLAVKQKGLYPTLAKEHVARQPWVWKPGSKALDEARKALTSNDH